MTRCLALKHLPPTRPASPELPNFALKGCPRCGGDLFKDYYGERSCLQCGYVEPKKTPCNTKIGGHRW